MVVSYSGHYNRLSAGRSGFNSPYHRHLVIGCTAKQTIIKMFFYIILKHRNGIWGYTPKNLIKQTLPIIFLYDLNRKTNDFFRHCFLSGLESRHWGH